MPNPILSGATNGAVVGAISGLLLFGVLKVFKLDRYFGGKTETDGNNQEPRSTGYANRRSLYDTPTPARTETALIAVMWTITGLLILISMAMNKALAPAFALLDLPACIIAIVLLCKAGFVNKGNGAAKLALEAVAFVAAFLAASHQPASIPGLPGPTMPTFPTRQGIPPNFTPPGHIVAPPHFHMPPTPPLPPGPFGPH